MVTIMFRWLPWLIWCSGCVISNEIVQNWLTSNLLSLLVITLLARLLRGHLQAGSSEYTWVNNNHFTRGLNQFAVCTSKMKSQCSLPVLCQFCSYRVSEKNKDYHSSWRNKKPRKCHWFLHTTLLPFVSSHIVLRLPSSTAEKSTRSVSYLPHVMVAQLFYDFPRF